MALNLVAYASSDESDQSDAEVQEESVSLQPTVKPSLSSVLPSPKQPTEPVKTLVTLEVGHIDEKISDDEDDYDANTQTTEQSTSSSSNAEEDVFKLLAHLPKPTSISAPAQVEEDFIPKPSAKELALAEQVKLEKLEKKSEPAKPKSRVKITIPSLKQFEDHEDEEESKPKPKIPTSGGISGLFSILPPPKTGFNNVVDNSKKSNLIPQQLTRKPPTEPPKKKAAVPKPSPKLIAYESDEEEESDFFSLSKPAPVFDPKVIEAERLPPLEDKRPQVQVKPTIEVYEPAPKSPSPLPDPAPIERVDLDQQALLRLQGKRKREEPVDILEVSEAQVNPNPHYYQLKALSEEKTDQTQFRPGAGPKGLVKTRHQITYLAYQAKAREVELKNEWAQGKANRQQSKMKYGF